MAVQTVAQLKKEVETLKDKLEETVADSNVHSEKLGKVVERLTEAFKTQQAWYEDQAAELVAANKNHNEPAWVTFFDVYHTGLGKCSITLKEGASGEDIKTILKAHDAVYKEMVARGTYKIQNASQGQNNGSQREPVRSVTPEPIQIPAQAQAVRPGGLIVTNQTPKPAYAPGEKQHPTTNHSNPYTIGKLKIGTNSKGTLDISMWEKNMPWLKHRVLHDTSERVAKQLNQKYPNMYTEEEMAMFFQAGLELEVEWLVEWKISEKNPAYVDVVDIAVPAFEA